MTDTDETVTPPGSTADQAVEETSDRWQIALVVLVLLAVIAVVVMLFTGSDIALKIGVVVALWAAVLGVFLVSRYRGQVLAERRDRKLADRMHEEELEREIAVHREQELILEQSFLESLDEYRDTTLAEIREQLDFMRAQLEALSGQTWSYEPAALQAEARRIQELLSGPSGAEAREVHSGLSGEVPPDMGDGVEDGQAADVEEVEVVPETTASATGAVTSTQAGRMSRGTRDTGTPEASESGTTEVEAAPEEQGAVAAQPESSQEDTPDEDTTGAFAPVSRPSWLTSPSAMKPNPLITGEAGVGGTVPVDASYLIAGGGRHETPGGESAEHSSADTGDETSASRDNDGSVRHGDAQKKGFDTGAMGAVPWDATGSSAARRAAHAVETGGGAVDEQSTERRHGRRRRDERGGVSVAELLEHLRENQADDQ
ncbi:DUF6779 domain-containing protein [Corynebacterium sp. CCM 9203]|uniref:DUF6779 domain-containing protein n=1 Tax=Corynebacterium sp. CCM 9203 TaxID=3057615 RepID=UPI0035264D51